MTDKPTPILMTRDNPEGHKLEDLLFSVENELHAKTERLFTVSYDADKLKIAMMVAENNFRIMQLLRDARGYQMGTLAMLQSIAQDQGPTGTPRL
jgi:hypothetical protein